MMQDQTKHIVRYNIISIHILQHKRLHERVRGIVVGFQLAEHENDDASVERLAVDAGDLSFDLLERQAFEFLFNGIGAAGLMALERHEALRRSAGLSGSVHADQVGAGAGVVEHAVVGFDEAGSEGFVVGHL